MKPLLIAVSGHAGAGKDTVADFLVQERNFTKVSLADPLKRFCKDVFNFDREQLWGPSYRRNEEDLRYVRQEKGSLGSTYEGPGQPNSPSPKRDIYLTPRFALQTLGTEWGRMCNKDIWVTYAMRIAEVLLRGDGYYVADEGITGTRVKVNCSGVVIPDARFMNEFEAIRKAGGKVIRLYRESADGNVGISGHASESEQNLVDDDYFDAVIHNNGSKEKLYGAITELYNQWAAT